VGGASLSNWRVSARTSIRKRGFRKAEEVFCEEAEAKHQPLINQVEIIPVGNKSQREVFIGDIKLFV